MKTVGLLGGMSWESSIEYYRIINKAVRERLGGLHSAKCVMYSVDFAEISELQYKGMWDEATEMMIDAARRLQNGGADSVLICTNTMHKMADDVQANIDIPLLHIVDETAKEIKATGLKKVGLLGTKFTMEQDFYRERLVKKFGLEVIIPGDGEREIVNSVIYDELCRGKVDPSSKVKFIEIIENLAARGAEGVILGCTEIPILVNQEDVQIPLFDTTQIHALAAVEHAFQA